jgi:hypothetical protein
VGILPGPGLSPEGDCPYSDGPCIDDYLAFPETAAAWAAPLTDDEFDNIYANMMSGMMPLVEGPMSEDELREALPRAMRVEFLTDGVAERELLVSEGDPVPVAQAYPTAFLTVPATATIFQLEDPFVGAFRGVLVKPEGEGPFPLFVGIHGHTEEQDVWVAGREAGRLVEAGYAFLAPTMRVNNADE